jgi:uroporphyrinogen-III decarboxylase
VGETDGRAHIVNLGHGVLPETPIESAAAFFDAVKIGTIEMLKANS